MLNHALHVPMLNCDLCDFVQKETTRVYMCPSVYACLGGRHAYTCIGNATRYSTGEVCESANLRLSDSQTDDWWVVFV